jgi:hypothetical protein
MCEADMGLLLENPDFSHGQTPTRCLFIVLRCPK